MAEPVNIQRPMSVEEYLEFEMNSPTKHEFVGGRLYAMTGVSRPHSLISGNIFSALRASARGGSCRVHQSDMKVPTTDGPYYYPDVVVACGREPDDEYIEDEPCLIVEVISPNTEATDRREKLAAYQKMPSVGAYLIVEQKERRVERHFRDDEGRWWIEEFAGEGSFEVPCPPGAHLSLDEIYEGSFHELS